MRVACPGVVMRLSMRNFASRLAPTLTPSIEAPACFFKSPNGAFTPARASRTACPSRAVAIGVVTARTTGVVAAAFTAPGARIDPTSPTRVPPPPSPRPPPPCHVAPRDLFAGRRRGGTEHRDHRRAVPEHLAIPALAGSIDRLAAFGGTGPDDTLERLRHGLRTLHAFLQPRYHGDGIEKRAGIGGEAPQRTPLGGGWAVLGFRERAREVGLHARLIHRFGQPGR